MAQSAGRYAMNSFAQKVIVGALALILPGFAEAATAVATADLHVRSGPGPHYPVVGVIEENGTADLVGCLAGSRWCQVTQEGTAGWSYSEYLTVDISEQSVPLSESWQGAEVPPVTYLPPAGAAAAPRVTGALIAPPSTRVPVIAPPPPVQTYVLDNRRDPVFLDGEVVVGAALPETVELFPVPQYEYQYAYVNQVPVLVQPDTRRVVYVYR